MFFPLHGSSSWMCVPCFRTLYILSWALAAAKPCYPPMQQILWFSWLSVLHWWGSLSNEDSNPIRQAIPPLYRLWCLVSFCWYVTMVFNYVYSKGLPFTGYGRGKRHALVHEETSHQPRRRTKESHTQWLQPQELQHEGSISYEQHRNLRHSLMQGQNRFNWLHQARRNQSKLH